MGRILDYLRAVWGVVRHGPPTVTIGCKGEWLAVPSWVRVKWAEPLRTDRVVEMTAGESIKMGAFVCRGADGLAYNAKRLERGDT